MGVYIPKSIDYNCWSCDELWTEVIFPVMKQMLENGQGAEKHMYLY